MSRTPGFSTHHSLVQLLRVPRIWVKYRWMLVTRTCKWRYWGTLNQQFYITRSNLVRKHKWKQGLKSLCLKFHRSLSNNTVFTVKYIQSYSKRTISVFPRTYMVGMIKTGQNTDCKFGNTPTFNQSAMTMTEGSVMVLSSSLVALFFSSL